MNQVQVGLGVEGLGFKGLRFWSFRVWEGREWRCIPSSRQGCKVLIQHCWGRVVGLGCH